MKRLLSLLALPLIAAAPAPDYSARIDRVLKATPLIDGHNDWPGALLGRAGEKRWSIDLNRLDPNIYDTDIERLRTGRVGGQFWSVFVNASLPGLEQVKATLGQIDLVHDIVRRYPETFELAHTAADMRRIHKAGKIGSLIGVEGGGQIDGSFSVLRAYHARGASYLTLTHSRTIAWADSATDNPRHDGLTPFGLEVVRELNRLGMLVDLSHVNEAVMLDAIAASRAPVIFSHSSARGVTDHPRNASDAVLRRLAANGGVIMVNFAPAYISDTRRLWAADRAAEVARANSLHNGAPDRATAAMAEWDKAHPRPDVTTIAAADHVDHIAKVAGHDHVGLGADFDGLGGDLPSDLRNVETYPRLLAELMRRGWSDGDIAKLAGGNILRVMEGAEATARAMAKEPPATATIEMLDRDEVKRRPTLLAIAAALASAPLGAARPAALAGHYYLQGVMETGSELVMAPDGKFVWYLSYGALDLFAEGTWDAVGGEVVLTARADSKGPPPGFETLKLQVKDGRLIPPDGKGGYVKAK